MTLTVRPATHADLGRLDPAFHPMVWKGMVIQLARGPAAALVETGGAEPGIAPSPGPSPLDTCRGGGETVMAIVGLYPQGAEAELYVWVSPGLRGTPDAVRLVLAMRHLKGLLPPGLKVFAAVKPGHAAGRRLARLMGFWHAGTVAGLGLERWVYRGKES